MGNRAAGTVWVALLACGCHAAPVGPRPAAPTVVPAAAELPPVSATPIEPELKPLPRLDPKPPAEATSFRGLTEPVCQSLAAQNTPAANLLDAENQSPAKGGCEAANRTRQVVRYYTALELRNQSAAAALERFFQLADAEARTELLRKVLPVIDGLRDRAEKAKAAGVRYPLDPADLDRQRSQLLAQMAEADAGVRLLNLDLRRRLGLPPDFGGERLRPTGAFDVEPGFVDEAAAVAAALAERPELRAWRALAAGLNADTLPAVRDLLRTINPLLGSGGEVPDSLCKLLLAGVRARHGPDADTLAELEVRRRQLADVIAGRERVVADETRAAAIEANARLRRVGLAHDRAAGRKAEWDEAIKRRAANLPGAELAAAQAEVEWLRARAEAVAELAAWHQARVRLKAAQGRLAWETAPAGTEPPPPGDHPGGGRPAGRLFRR